MGAQGRRVSARRKKGSCSPQRSPREQIWITGSCSGSGKMPAGGGEHRAPGEAPEWRLPLLPQPVLCHRPWLPPFHAASSPQVTLPTCLELPVTLSLLCPTVTCPLVHSYSSHPCPVSPRHARTRDLQGRMPPWGCVEGGRGSPGRDGPLRPAHSMSKLSTRRGAIRCHGPSGG